KVLSYPAYNWQQTLTSDTCFFHTMPLGAADCAGETNGEAGLDACGVCAGGTTGITPNACADCAGTINGTNLSGTPCSDGNFFTVNDRFNDLCQCLGDSADCFHVIGGTALPGATDFDCLHHTLLFVDDHYEGSTFVPAHCDAFTTGPIAMDGPCSDGDPCTTGETYLVINDSTCVCQGGTPISGDSDGDGVCDAGDFCPGTVQGVVNERGCSCAQLTIDDLTACTTDNCTDGNVSHILIDDDSDGVCDLNDQCSGTAMGETVNASGCSCAQVLVDDGDACTTDNCLNGNVTHFTPDTDQDGVCDANDQCSGTAMGDVVNASGCSCAQVSIDDGDPCTQDDCSSGVVSHVFVDSDLDLICDAQDLCPNEFGEPGSTCDDGTEWTTTVLSSACICDVVINMTAEEVAGACTFILYPNPAGTSVTAFFPALRGNIRFDLLDATGRIVLSQQLRASGDGRYLIDLNGIATGAYSLRAYHGADPQPAQRLLIN
ncbi:MAG TPA: T9SS type A sorting domain-containing protein, partial [Flavobacteriales bacterium]|nr:T9SS type A sorting domain-containing protein [Flavobacteriales bacterium]